MIMMIDEMITVKDYVKSLREDKENYFYTLYNPELNETEEEIAARIEKSIKSAKSENEAQKFESLLA